VTQYITQLLFSTINPKKIHGLIRVSCLPAFISFAKKHKTKMTATKKLGIWMDHSKAHLIEFSPEPMEASTIESKFTHEAKESSLERSETIMHNKEQHEQSDYYKHLGEAIRKYDDVVLFGPTEAKSELLNVLRKNHLFEKIKIEVKPADNMSEVQQHTFVKEYFSK
jgi:hypothetical protein